MADGNMPRARFHSMCDGTKEDWDCISQAMKPFIVELPDRVLTHLKLLEGDCGGFAVDRLEHSLQTATRAHRDGRDEEYVVCALLHDIGDILGPRNHADIAAAILKPFVSEREPLDGREARDLPGLLLLPPPRPRPQHARGIPRPPVFRRAPRSSAPSTTARRSIPRFDSMPLEEFEPMVRRVFATVKNSIYVPKAAAATV